MYPTYTSDTSHSSSSNTTTLLNTPIRKFHHARKLSHVQVGKKKNSQDDYTSSSLMIPFDEIHPQPFVKEPTPYKPFFEPDKREIDERLKRKKHWLFARQYCGPFSKGEHWPMFTYIMIFLSVIIFSGELLLSKQHSGEFLELQPFNYMLGPSIEVMIQVGARFPPCMRRVESMPPEEHYVCLQTQKPGSLLLLDPVVDLADPRLLNSSCSLASICGMSSFYEQQVPDQTYRFFTPLLVHTGMIHLAINVCILFLLGKKIEKVMNPLRVSILFVGSGIFGHALGANFAPPTTPFLGFSGSLFGYIGFLYIDLIANWKQLEQPVRYLIRLLLSTAISFILGLLPGVDNFSHMGGLVSGILLSLFLMPPIQYNTVKLKYGVYIMRFICLVLYSFILGILIHHFNTSNIDEECPYCRYLSCLPIHGFCD